MAKILLQICTYFTLILLIGIGITIILFSSFLKIEIPFKMIDIKYSSYIVNAYGAILIITPILSCLKKSRKNNALNIISICIIFMLSTIILGFGGFILYFRNLLGENLSSEDNCIINFHYFEDSVIKSDESMCTLYCPCYATDNYVISQVSDPKYATVEGGAVDILHCDPCLAIPDASDNDTQAIIDWIDNNLDFSVTKSACSIAANNSERNFLKKS